MPGMRFAKLSMLLVLVALLAACAPGVDADALATTAQRMIEAGVAQTLTAAPTQVPPTAVPSDTPTQQPSPTETPSETALPPTEPPASDVQGTQISVVTPLSGTAQADKTDKQTPILLQNNTDQVAWVIFDGDAYGEYRFSDSMIVQLPQGHYHYRAYIGQKGPYEGDIFLNNEDKHTMVISTGKVRFQYP